MVFFDIVVCIPLHVAGPATRDNTDEPNTVFEDRINQIDFRAAKLFRTGAGRVRLTFDLYNLLNNAAVQGRNNTFGSAWGTPTRILSGRLAKFGAQLSF